ncbi:MAG: immune inhibitor A [Chloroflexi bacterium]|nr:immune inhibitor A [Chloroflexota bacterium]
MLGIALLAAACGGQGQPSRPTPTPTIATATPGAAAATPTTPLATRDEPPARDLVDLARRLRGQSDPPRRVDLPPPSLGDSVSFDLIVLPQSREDRPGRRATSATLRTISTNAYFFVEDDADVNDDEIEDAARVFEEEVWPKVTDAFGPPPSPGVDGDPRIYILHADLGAGLGGYVSGEDFYPREVVPHSNGREILYMNLSVRLGSAGYANVLAHELQHLIHDRNDADEEAWVNEGLSEFAATLVRGSGGSVAAFLNRPDTQLNTWEHGLAGGAHYDASDLFFTYLLEQSGGDSRQLAAEPGDGIAGVRAFLQANGYPRSFAELVADWTVANLLDQPEGPYGYRDRELDSPAKLSVQPGQGEGEVSQFAADYLELHANDFAGEAVFRFDGEAETPIIAAQDSANGAFWWSNRGDNIDTTLTRELDLTGVEQATLTFRSWHSIERWFDYSYVVVSRDDGHTWTALPGRQTTTDDPMEVTYGPGYTGRSGGGTTARWVEEEIDLSAYAGARILLRFEYVTDDSLNGPGWAIDDIAVPEIGFFDDAEAGEGGWQREGFLRVSEPLRQRFELRLVTLGATTEVSEIPLDGQNQAEVALTGLGTEYQHAVIVVVAVTEGTTEPALYRYEATSVG